MARTRIFSLTGLVVLASCGAGIRYGADFAPEHDFARYSTFQWEAADPLPTGDPRLDANPFFDQRIRAAVEAQLLARGLRPSSDPDLTVHFHVAVRERLEIFEPDRTQRVEPGTAPEVRSWEEGTLLVDIVDRAAGDVVWRGWAQTDVTGLADDPRREEARIQEAVVLMFERFPIDE